jgi:hypothetical protein
VLGVIDTQVKKEVYEFHFPTIENKQRNIEPVEVTPSPHRPSTPMSTT